MGEQMWMEPSPSLHVRSICCWKSLNMRQDEYNTRPVLAVDWAYEEARHLSRCRKSAPRGKVQGAGTDIFTNERRRMGKLAQQLWIN